jgi:hypothetical protein
MNLYLLFAIALGAISGTTDVTVAGPRFASVAAECGAVTCEHAIVSPRSALHHGRSESAASRSIDEAPVRIAAPLAGASTPRAPATNC